MARPRHCSQDFYEDLLFVTLAGILVKIQSAINTIKRFIIVNFFFTPSFRREREQAGRYLKLNKRSSILNTLLTLPIGRVLSL
jgi:hypothetical protein